MIYLTPYQYIDLPVSKFWYRYDLKPDRSWYGFIHRDIDRRFNIHYRDKNNNTHRNTFSTLEKSQLILDQELMEEGYILLTEEQYEKFKILI